MRTISRQTVTLRSVPCNPLARRVDETASLRQRMGRASDALGGLLSGSLLPFAVRAQIAAAQYEIEAGLLDAEAR